MADDEDNLIRIYDAERGGPPLQVAELSGLSHVSKEMDLEAATRIGDLGLWLASHGRTKAGKRKKSRLNLFLSTAPSAEAPLELVGSPYSGLLDALVADSSLEPFQLAAAAARAPDKKGGLNLEGMTARPDGGVIIGFRSPVPDGLALIVGLSNPVAVAKNGAAPRLDAFHRLDLGEGRGVRGLSEWRGTYLVIGGSPTYTTASKLYSWDGVSSVAALVPVDLSAYNPEGFYTPEGKDIIMILSDDGAVDHAGTPCKRLRNPEAKRFRGVWVDLPTKAAALPLSVAGD